MEKKIFNNKIEKNHYLVLPIIPSKNKNNNIKSKKIPKNENTVSFNIL